MTINDLLKELAGNWKQAPEERRRLVDDEAYRIIDKYFPKRDERQLRKWYRDDYWKYKNGIEL